MSEFFETAQAIGARLCRDASLVRFALQLDRRVHGTRRRLDGGAKVVRS